MIIIIKQAAVLNSTGCLIYCALSLKDSQSVHSTIVGLAS